MEARTFGAIAREFMVDRIGSDDYQVEGAAWIKNYTLPWIDNR